jgi:hypothetical protein
MIYRAIMIATISLQAYAQDGPHAPLAAPERRITFYTGGAINVWDEIPQVDKNGRPKLDVNGKQKTKRTRRIESITVRLPITSGKLVAARWSNQYLGSESQYTDLSPLCLNNVWCRVIVGGPSVSTTAVYRTYSWFVIQGPTVTYIAYDDSPEITTWPVNAEVQYGIDGGILYARYPYSMAVGFSPETARKLTIHQIILNQPPQSPPTK